MYGNYSHGNTMMMGGGFGWLGFLFWLVIFVDFILLGVWLWQQIQSNKKK